MKEFFLIDEDFNKIINNNITNRTKAKTIYDLSPISTGWTNIVYKVKTDIGNYFFRFPRDIFWEKTIVKDYEFAKYINGKTGYSQFAMVPRAHEKSPAAD